MTLEAFIPLHHLGSFATSGEAAAAASSFRAAHMPFSPDAAKAEPSDTLAREATGSDNTGG